MAKILFEIPLGKTEELFLRQNEYLELKITKKIGIGIFKEFDEITAMFTDKVFFCVFKEL